MRRAPVHRLLLVPLLAIAGLGAACADEETPGVRAADGGLEDDLGVASVVATLDDVGVFDSALAETELRGTLEDLDAEYTVLAPTDDSFDRVADANGITAVNLLDLVDEESRILEYHVLEGLYTIEELEAMDGVEVATLAGIPVTIRGEGDEITINESALVLRGDLPAENGLVHVIGGVLLPPGTPLEAPDPFVLEG